MLDGLLDDILKNSPDAGEIRPDSPLIRPAQSRAIAELSPNSPVSPALNAFGDDDRRFCRECRHLNRSCYCTAQRFRPVDNIPRRCEDFAGYPDRRPTVQTSAFETPKSPTPAAPPADPLAVEVYTPSGTALMTRADNPAHADWLRRVNPRPANPAPKPDPTPSSCMVDEAGHNAAGRFFKFQITQPDGTQFYSCSMPRQTTDEMRRQYPTAITIEPIENEEYPDDEI